VKVKEVLVPVINREDMAQTEAYERLLANIDFHRSEELEEARQAQLESEGGRPMRESGPSEFPAESEVNNSRATCYTAK